MAQESTRNPNKNPLRPTLPAEIHVSFLSGDAVYIVYADHTYDVSDVKNDIAWQSGIPFREQRLIHNGQVLNDSDAPWVRYYVVSNKHLGSKSRGIVFRSTMQLHDKATRAPERGWPNGPVATWGARVRGVQASSEWIKVGRVFLPIHVDGKRVLFETEGHWGPARSAPSACSKSFLEITLVRIDPIRAAALERVRLGAYEYAALPEDLRKDREITLQAAQADGFVLNHRFFDAFGTGIPFELRDDVEINLAAMRTAPACILESASEKLKNNRDFFLTLLEYRPTALEYAANTLKDEPFLVLRFVSKAWHNLAAAGPNCKNNREIVLSAIRQDLPVSSSALCFAGDAMKDDRDVVLKAVSGFRQGGALRYASERLREDPAVVLAAIDSERSCRDANIRPSAADAFALEFAGLCLQSKRSFWRKAVGLNFFAFHRRDQKFSRDQGLIFQYRAKRRGWRAKRDSASRRSGVPSSRKSKHAHPRSGKHGGHASRKKRVRL